MNLIKPGMAIIAIRDHSQLNFRKNDIFIAEDTLKLPCCNHSVVKIETGIKFPNSFTRHCLCGAIFQDIFLNYYGQESFKPYYPEKSETTFEEISNEVCTSN